MAKVPIMQIWDDATQQYVAIPSIQGAKGDTGFSPTVSISAIPGGHRVTITDAAGSKSFDVMDGESGPQGDTGAAGADGKSAYASAKEGGYTGTEAQFNTDLAAVGGKQAKITASGILKGDGSGGVAAAAPGTDYSGPKATVTATLLAASWTGSEEPFVYTLAIAGVTATSYQELVPAVNITAEQLKALQAANITDAGQAAGTMTLKAYGKKPAVDIPIRVIKEGE